MLSTPLTSQPRSAETSSTHNVFERPFTDSVNLPYVRFSTQNDSVPWIASKYEQITGTNSSHLTLTVDCLIN